MTFTRNNNKPRNNNAWLQVGSVLESKKEPGKHYVKLSEDIPARNGRGEPTILQLQDPREMYDKLVASGKMTQEEADDKKAGVPAFVKYNLILPPS